MNRFLLFFKVGIAIALLVAVLTFSGCSKSNLALSGKPLRWRNATEIIPPDIIQAAIRQSTSILEDQWSSVPVRASKIEGRQNVIFLNFDRSPQLCGQLGCLGIALLEQSHALIWKSYWNPNLPEKTPLLVQHDAQTMPSFVVNQLNGQHIQQILHRWDGKEYHVEQVVINQ